MSSNHPEEFPADNSIKAPIHHGGEATPIEFDKTRLDEVAADLKAPDTVNAPVELRGSTYIPITPEQEAEAREQVAASYPDTQPKSKKKLFIGLGTAAAGLALAIGAVIHGANSGATPGGVKTTVPSDTQPTASAPVIPGAGETPAPTAPAETARPVDIKDFTFNTGENGESQSLDELKQSLALSVDEIDIKTDVVPLVIERMKKAANYAPSEKSVRESLNKPTGQLTIDDYMLVYEQYLKAHDVMFSVKSGDFYDTLQTICRQTAYEHLMSINAGEAVPYAVNLELHTNKTGLRISDNSEQNAVGDNVLDYLGDYRLMSAGRDVVSDNGHWYVAGNMELIRKDQ